MGNDLGGFFEQPYYDELVRMSKMKYGVDTLTPEMQKRVDLVFEEQMGRVVDIYQYMDTPYYGDGGGDYLFIKTMNNLVKTDAILTFNGIFDRKPSVISQILAKKLAERAKYKTMSLEYLEAGDMAKGNLYSAYEKFRKEVANSSYGVLGLPSFFLFNILTASSITGNASTQLQMIITLVENIYGGRVILRDYNELITYLSGNILDRNLTDDELENTYRFLNIMDVDSFNKFDHDALYERLRGYCRFDLGSINDKQEAYLLSLIDRIMNCSTHRLRFYYLNDLERFLDDNTWLEHYIRSGHANVCDLEKFNEKEMDKYLDANLLPYIQTLVYDRVIPHDNDSLCRNYDRTTVLMSDTDSLFVKTKRLTDFLKRTIHDVSSAEGQDLDVFTFRILTYLGTKVTRHALNIQAAVNRIGQDNGFKYKSEMYYPKILLLPIRKTYTGMCTVREGYKIPPFLDMKNIVKTSYTKPSTDFIKELCSTFTDVDKKFSYADTFTLIEKHKNKIRNIIQVDKDATVGRPLRYKNREAYASPFSIANFLAGEMYNIFHPRDRLPPGSRCNSVDLVLPTGLTGGRNLDEERNIQIMIEYYSQYLNEEELNIFEGIMSSCESTYLEMREYILKQGGIPYIGIPHGETIPDNYLGMVDVESLVMKNIDSRSVNFLAAVGIYVDENSKGSTITNLINF